MTIRTLLRPRMEQLETRRCLAAVIEAVGFETPSGEPAVMAPNQEETEATIQLDTNGDGVVTANDALLVINYLGRIRLSEGGEIDAQEMESPDNLDANGDGRVSSLDALVIINRLGLIETNVPVQGSSSSFTNPNNPFDVNNSGTVSSEDVDQILSTIERFGVGDTKDLIRNEVGFIDANQDGVLSSVDALAVINHLAKGDDDTAGLETQFGQSF